MYIRWAWWRLRLRNSLNKNINIKVIAENNLLSYYKSHLCAPIPWYLKMPPWSIFKTMKIKAFLPCSWCLFTKMFPAKKKPFKPLANHLFFWYIHHNKNLWIVVWSVLWLATRQTISYLWYISRLTFLVSEFSRRLWCVSRKSHLNFL